MSWDRVRQARQRLSRERGTIIKDWGGRIPIALIYPNSYYVGMSNLGIHVIYSFLNSYRDVVCERVFWERDNNARPLPAWSLESQRPLSDFAVIAFSVTYELDYFNVVQILKASGIPVRAADRDESHPLIIGGGPCITANPMPLSPFFDCLCIGEAEPILPAILPVLISGIRDKRHKLLEALASLPGLYVPQHYTGTPVVRQWAENIDNVAAVSTILTPFTELGNLYLIEVERGCNWGCRFCLVSTAFRPMRFRSVNNLIAQAKIGLQYKKRLGLVGPAVSDHPHIEELVTNLHELGAELSISSLRIKPLPEVLLEEIARAGARTIAFAPEAGSERLREVIRKGINEYDILASVDKAARQGVTQLKLYFMVGLPSESDDDIDEITYLTLKCKSVVDRQQTGCRITLSISPFVPKAGTPFQWLPMDSVKTLSHRLSMLKNSLQPKGIKIKAESPAWSEIQGILARGDIRVAEVLDNMEEVSLSGWRQAVKKSHLATDFHVHKRWDTHEMLPWAVIDSGTEPEKLKLEMDKSLPNL